MGTREKLVGLAGLTRDVEGTAAPRVTPLGTGFLVSKTATGNMNQGARGVRDRHPYPYLRPFPGSGRQVGFLQGTNLTRPKLSNLSKLGSQFFMRTQQVFQPRPHPQRLLVVRPSWISPGRLTLHTSRRTCNLLS